MSTANEQTTAKIPKRVIWLALAGAVGGFLFGFDSSVVNGAVDAMKDEFALSEAVTGFAVAVALLGCAAGAYMAGKVADRYVKQVQFQMACTGRAWCDFVSYDPRMRCDLQLFIRRIPRDDAMIAEIEDAVRFFIMEMEAKIRKLDDLARAA